MFCIICISSLVFLFAAAVEFTPKGCGNNVQYGYDDSHYSFISTQPRCRLSTDLSIPWPVSYTISVRLQSIGGSTPGIFFNERDDFNYDFVFFRTGDIECVRAGTVRGNALQEYTTYNRVCSGNTIHDGAWFDVNVTVSVSAFYVSVNKWNALIFPTGNKLLPVNPSLGLIHGVNYEFHCSNACQINADDLSIIPSNALLYNHTETHGILELPQYGTSTAVPTNAIFVFRIIFNRLGEPAESYCFISFHFKEFDVGFGLLSIEGQTNHARGNFETYKTRSPHLDVMFNSMNMTGKHKGFSILYNIIKCGVTNVTDNDMSFLCTRGNHDELDDNYYRSTANTEDSTNSDSSLAVGWYRFNSCAGNTIPTLSPGRENVCGTKFPIWMTDETQGRVCMYKTGAECAEEWIVPIHVCPTFNLYYLTPTPVYSGYCAGTNRKCDASQNETSNDGSGCAPCVVGLFPRMTSKPTIDDWTSVNNGYNLPCKVNGPQNPGVEVLYQVQWHIDFGTHRTILSDSQNFNTDTTYYLHSDFLRREHLQNNVKCRVRAQYRNMNAGEWVESEPFFIGIKVLKAPTASISDDVFLVETQITAPLSTSGDTDCSINVVFASTTEGLHQQTACDNFIYMQPEPVYLNPCVHSVNCSNWGRVLKHAITVKNTLQNLPVSTHTHTLYIATKSDDALWNNIIQAIKVPVKSFKSPDKYCYVRNDPRVTTFQGSEYDVHQAGEHIIYRSKPTDDKDMQVLVTAEFYRCFINSLEYCTHAIAIRVKEEAIVIDNRQSPPHRYMGPGFGEMGFRLVLSRSRRTYTVHLPRGERIFVCLNWFGVNIAIHSKMDAQAESGGNGLCGKISQSIRKSYDIVTPNGTLYRTENNRWGTQIAKNEILNGFGNLWRAREDDQIIGKSSLTNQRTRLKDDVYSCKLRDGNVILATPANNPDLLKPTLDVERCFIKRSGMYHLMDELRRQSFSVTKRKKRQAEKTFKYDYDTRVKRSEHVVWTEEAASSYCFQQIIDSPTGRACNETAPDALTLAFEHCIADILLMNSTEWTEGTIESLQDVCVVTLFKKLDTWTFDENVTYGENATEFSPPEYIVQDLCPEDCSGNGKCVGGECQCESGFIGTDCSIDIETTPLLEATLDGNICYTHDACEDLRIIGNNLVQTDELTCHFKIQFAKGSKSTDINMAGFLESYDVVSCKWPDITGEKVHTTLSVSVSNDGVHASEALAGIAAVHYPCFTCDTMDGEIECSFQDGWCLIDEECVAGYENSTDHLCWYCNPSLNTQAWTRNTGPECANISTTEIPSTKASSIFTPKITSPSTTIPKTASPNMSSTGSNILPWHYIVIAICCLTLLGIVIGLTMVMMKWRQKKFIQKYEVTRDFSQPTAEDEDVNMK